MKEATLKISVIVSYFLLLSKPGLSIPGEIERNWPLLGNRLVSTHWSSWKSGFITVDEKFQLQHFSLRKKQLFSRQIYSYGRGPDIIKHFPLESGDLIISIFNREKKIHILAFNSKGEIIYLNEHSLDFAVLDADLRISDDGSPVCLFSTYSNNNYGIKFWNNGKTSDIFNSADPIEVMFLQWKENTVHLLSNVSNRMQWITWQNKKYSSLPLPFLIKKARFFSWRNTIYLIGLDLESGLWRFNLSNSGINQARLIRDKRFAYAENIIPYMTEKQLAILLTGTSVNNTYRLLFNDFLDNKRKPGISSKTSFWMGKITPLTSDQNEIMVLNETSQGHIYAESWSGKDGLMNFNWKVNAVKNPPVLSIHWQNAIQGTVSYRYLLDQNERGDPLPDYKLIPGNKLTFDGLEDGAYTFHIQAQNNKTGIASPLYHVPVAWKYNPPEPEVVMLNEISPRLIKPGPVEFFIKNLQPAVYFAEINSIPKYEPRKKIDTGTGRISLKFKGRPGRYYLHVASLDLRSGIKSTPASTLFFIDPYNPEQDPTISENSRQLGEIQIILRKIENARNDPEELQKWIRRLKELEQEIGK